MESLLSLPGVGWEPPSPPRRSRADGLSLLGNGECTGWAKRGLETGRGRWKYASPGPSEVHEVEDPAGHLKPRLDVPIRWDSPPATASSSADFPAFSLANRGKKAETKPRSHYSTIHTTLPRPETNHLQYDVSFDRLGKRFICTPDSPRSHDPPCIRCHLIQERLSRLPKLRIDESPADPIRGSRSPNTHRPFRVYSRQQYDRLFIPLCKPGNMTDVEMGGPIGLSADPSAIINGEEAAITTFAPTAAMDAIKPEDAPSPPLPIPIPFGADQGFHIEPLTCDDGHAVPNPISLNGEANGSLTNGNGGRIAAYAKLEFSDGQYYMNTISIIVGRDIAIRKEARRQAARSKRKENGAESSAQLGDEARSAAHSVVSESGGLLGYGSKKRKRKSKAGSSGSDAIKESLQAFDQALLQDGPPDMNEEDLLPDPYECPLVAIHQPTQQDGSMPISKSISRKHAKIAYDYNSESFQMTVLGRNGLFVDNQHYALNEVVELQHGNQIEIGGVPIKFVLPNEAVPNGDDQDLASSSGQISHAFEGTEGGDLEADDFDDIEDLAPEERFNNSHLYQPYEDSDEESEPAQSIEDEAPRTPRIKLTLKERQEVAKQRAKTAERETARKLAKKQSKAPNGRVKKRHMTKAERALDRKRYQAQRKLKKQEREASDDADEEEEEEDQEDVPEDEEDEEEKVVPSVEAAGKKPAKHAAKAPAKTPAEHPEPPTSVPKPTAASPTEPSMHLVARENDLVNGQDGVYVPNLPMGAIIPARKKGPGRPPKDGLMSKREKALINKHLKEVERAKKLGLDPKTIPELNLATTKPPKPNTEGGREVSGSALPIASSATPQVQNGEPLTPGDRVPSLIKREEPSQPEMKESDYTAEQLAKPAANYAVMLYDILKEHGRLNLQQIYEVMERKYPYFKFKAGTSGWQSSVRHNLGQNETFRKAEKDGKGYSWELNPDKPMEPPRKVKKAPSPPLHPPRAYANYPGAYPGQPPYPHQYPQGRPPLPPGAPQHFANSAQHNPQHFGANYPAPYNAQQQHNGAGPRPPNAPLPPGQRREPMWSRETLIKTVYKIYHPRLPGIDLQSVCETAVDWFLNQNEMERQGKPKPEGKEAEILKALKDAHAGQATQTAAGVPPAGAAQAARPPGAAPLPAGAHPTHAQDSASPAPPASIAPQTAVPHHAPGAPSQASNALHPAHTFAPRARASATPPQPATTFTHPPHQHHGGSSGPGTPQAPLPEPLTRPNSSQGVVVEAKSNTPPVEPPANASDQHGVKRARSSSVAPVDESEAKRVKENV